MSELQPDCAIEIAAGNLVRVEASEFGTAGFQYLYAIAVESGAGWELIQPLNYASKIGNEVMCARRSDTYRVGVIARSSAASKLPLTRFDITDCEQQLRDSTSLSMDTRYRFWQDIQYGDFPRWTVDYTSSDGEGACVVRLFSYERIRR